MSLGEVYVRVEKEKRNQCSGKVKGERLVEVSSLLELGILHRPPPGPLGTAGQTRLVRGRRRS